MPHKPWEELKPKIEHLYVKLDMPLGDVKDVLEREDGFRASLRSYKYQFSRWGWKKRVYNTLQRDSSSAEPSDSDHDFSSASQRSNSVRSTKTSVSSLSSSPAMPSINLQLPKETMQGNRTVEFSCQPTMMDADSMSHPTSHLFSAEPFFTYPTPTSQSSQSAISAMQLDATTDPSLLLFSDPFWSPAPPPSFCGSCGRIAQPDLSCCFAASLESMESQSWQSPELGFGGARFFSHSVHA